jgi:hypothetical protein
MHQIPFILQSTTATVPLMSFTNLFSNPQDQDQPFTIQDEPFITQEQPFITQDQPSTIQDPTALDVLRYRYHHGVNLGSVYVLERWLFPSRFPEDVEGTSELEAVKASVEKIGADSTKERFEDAWENAVSDADIEWLKNEAKCKYISCTQRHVVKPGHITCADPFANFVQALPFASQLATTIFLALSSPSTPPLNPLPTSTPQPGTTSVR